MNIKTKFDVGDEVFFFKDYDKAKPRVTKDIVGGTVADLKEMPTM